MGRAHAGLLYSALDTHLRDQQVSPEATYALSVRSSSGLSSSLITLRAATSSALCDVWGPTTETVLFLRSLSA